MISVSEADQIISDNISYFAKESIPFVQAAGKVLQEDIFAEREHPPFHRVAMDGISINYSLWEKGQREFPIEDVQRAGEAQKKLNNETNCLEVMTGAVLPLNTDCVIRVEDIRVENNIAIISDQVKLKQAQNIHQRGSDHPKGETLLQKGNKIFGAETAIIASAGKKDVLVTKNPKIAIISTGDELINPGNEIKDFQIRRSNPFAIQASLHLEGLSNTDLFHIVDNQNTMKAEIEKILEDFDVLILSGGVSMGKFDFVPTVLKENGVKQLIHKIRQKPGKPFWFGKKEDKYVFGLPGNPVSALVCLYRYIIPSLSKAMGQENQDAPLSVLYDDYEFKKKFTLFLPVIKRINAAGQITVLPYETNGSGDYASLGNTSGFVELPPEQSQFTEGEVYPFFSWSHY